MSFTVTATEGGSVANGILLSVTVLNNATIPLAPNAFMGPASGAGSGIFGVKTDGALVYSSIVGPSSGTPTATAGNTLIDGVVTAGSYLAQTVTSAPANAGDVVTTGVDGEGSAAWFGMCEVEKVGGDIAQDGSTPAPVFASGAHTVTTAAFSPPAGSLLVAMVAAKSGAGIPTMALSGSITLDWVPVVQSNGTGGFSGIYYVVVPPLPLVVTTAIPGGMTGQAYSFTMTAAAGTPGYTWAVTSGTLPPGLSLSSSGVLSGTPTTTGVYPVTLTVTDTAGQTAALATALVINASSAPGGTVRATWALAAGKYTYGTLQVPVATQDHSWLLVAVSWATGESGAISYCADNVHNQYQAGPLAIGPGICTQVFAVPDARAASTLYVSTSAWVRWLNVQVTEVPGLQPGYVVDASNAFTGAGTSLVESLSTLNPDFILAVGALSGTPQTMTQTGSGATWTALAGSFNGSASDGITQSVAWASTTGSASPSMTFGGVSGNFSGVMIAVRKQGGLPVNSNPAWPVISCQAAFGYTPQEPTGLPVWTDITTRFLGLTGERGRSFELDEVSAANLSLELDNFDGALSPGGSFGATLITPVRLTATWQGRTYSLFRGHVTALPQTYDFQRSIIKASVSDDYSRLSQILLPGCMISEMLFDGPVSLWPLNDQQGAASASNWSSRTPAVLVPTAASQGGGSTIGGSTPATQLTVSIFGFPIPVSTSLITAASGSTQTTSTSTPSTSNNPATGFGNSNSGIYPGGLAGTTDSVWGNTSALGTSNFYQGTVLVDSNDATLPLTSTGATYSVWANMLNSSLNTSTGAMVMALTDAGGTTSKKYLAVYYDGTHVTVSQTAGSHVFTPSSVLFDGAFHLWTATISTGGTVTVYVDGISLGSFSGTFPAGTPVMLQWGGDTTVTASSSAGLFTGYMSMAAVYDKAVDAERILAWYQSGATGFANELAGTRIQRVLTWAHWSAPQAVDPGVTFQQVFNYLTGGYGNNGLTGAIGNWNTAGGSVGVDQGALSDVTLQDIANTDLGFMGMMADGTIAFRQRSNVGNFPAGIAMGDMDYPLNTWETFESGLGPWTSTVSCTVARSSGWSYAGQHSALVTVTGSPVQAYAWGDSANVTPGETAGFSCWVMSPQGCSVQAMVDWWGQGFADTYDATYGGGYGDATGFGYLSTSSGPVVFCPPMTPVFLSLPGVTAPGGAQLAYPHPTIVSSPATGTQLYFDRARLSPSGFQVSYLEDVEITEDVQFLLNDIAITRNADQATYRARDSVSRSKYYPRVYTRTIYSSALDANAVPNAANTLLSQFSSPALRVSRVTVDAAANPELWPFVLSADIGDSVAFGRTPLGGAAVTGTFTILSVEPDIGPDKANFTYVLAPGGAF